MRNQEHVEKMALVAEIFCAHEVEPGEKVLADVLEWVLDESVPDEAVLFNFAELSELEHPTLDEAADFLRRRGFSINDSEEVRRIRTFVGDDASPYRRKVQYAKDRLRRAEEIVRMVEGS